MVTLAQGDEYRAAHNDISNALNAQLPFDIKYESINGKKYRTVVTMLAGQLKTEFQRL